MLVSIGLATASSFIVHLSGGYIEFHFHYFVMATLLVLYHDWAPLLTLVGLAAVEHGLIGGVNPHSVYNHPAALAAPWKWAALYALYIAAACVGSIVGGGKANKMCRSFRGPIIGWSQRLNAARWPSNTYSRHTTSWS